MYNQSDSPISISDETRRLIPQISVPTLRRDLRKHERDGAAALIAYYRGRGVIIESNPAMRDFIIATIAHNPSVRSPWLMDAIALRFPNRQTSKTGRGENFPRALEARKPLAA